MGPSVKMIALILEEVFCEPLLSGHSRVPHILYQLITAQHLSWGTEHTGGFGKYAAWIPEYI